MYHHSHAFSKPFGLPIVVRPADHDLTVIIPSYNEEKRLPWTLDHLTLFLDDWNLDWRIVVADDGSTDKTALLAHEFGPRCSTIRLDRNGGKGRVVRTAMLRCTGRVLAFTDADLPFDLSALRAGYELIANRRAEVIFGARDMEKSSARAKRKVSRFLATKVFRAVVRAFVSKHVTDTQCGLKLFDRQAALKIFSRTTIDGFAFDAEVVRLTERLGLPYDRVPVTLVNEYGSSISIRRQAWPMFKDVALLWLRDHFQRSAPEPHFSYETQAETISTAESTEQRAA